MNQLFNIVNKIYVVCLNHKTQLLVCCIYIIGNSLSSSLGPELDPFSRMILKAHWYTEYLSFDLIVNFDIFKSFGFYASSHSFIIYQIIGPMHMNQISRIGIKHKLEVILLVFDEVVGLG